MKNLYLVFFSFVFCGILQAQSLSPEVISSSGACYEANGINFSMTVGEPVISTLMQDNHVITQGFQQPDANFAFQTLYIPEGWMGISSFVDPFYKNVEGIFEKVENDLIILQSLTAIYWPSQQINTINNWDYLDAYKIKTSAAMEIVLYGTMASQSYIDLEQGWQLVPVLSSKSVDVASVLSPLADTCIILKEVAGAGIYWPSQGINTLGSLDPGIGYFILVSDPCRMDYDNGMASSGLRKEKQDIISPARWNTIIPSQSNHVVGIAKQALAKFRNGDIIGAFTPEGYCCGSLEVANRTQNQALLVFADDITTERKDGFIKDQSMEFRLYRPDSDEEFVIEPIFDEAMPQQGKYFDNGLSLIKDIVELTDIPEEELAKMNIQIYPNPADQMLHIVLNANTQEEMIIRLYDMTGRQILARKQNTHSLDMDVSKLAPGIYSLGIECEGNRIIRKLIIQ